MEKLTDREMDLLKAYANSSETAPSATSESEQKQGVAPFVEMKEEVISEGNRLFHHDPAIDDCECGKYKYSTDTFCQSCSSDKRPEAQNEFEEKIKEELNAPEEDSWTRILKGSISS